MKRFLLIMLAAAIFGSVTAYVSAQIFNSTHVDSEKSKDHWFDCFMISMAPAGVIDFLLRGDEYGFNIPNEDSIQGDGLKEAVACNAVGWMIISALVTFLIWSIKWACRAIFRALPSHAR